MLWLRKKKPEQFRVIIFSTLKDYENNVDKKIGVDDDSMENFVDAIKNAFKLAMNAN